MAKKILLGMLAVFVAIALATAGFHFGKHLAKADRDAGTPAAAQAG